MTRPELLKTDHHPYHVMSRCGNQRMFALPLDEVWTIINELLYRSYQEQGLRVHAFVLMGNHFHLLCETPLKNLDEIMRFLLSSSSRRMNKSSEWSRYKWSLIEAPAHYYQVYRYIFQNPIRAGLVNRVQDWPYSSLNQVPYPLCTHVPMSFCGEEGERIWLNEIYSPEDQQLIRRGLRKFQFDVNKKKIGDFRRLSSPK